jgi:beta-barrel assembly-enhancing protease
MVLLDLFNNVEPTPDQTRLIAKAASTAGDFADSYSYMAEFYLMTGNLQMAINQLQLALTLPGLDAVQRARYSARLEEVRSYLPKKNRDTVADDRGSNSGH